MKRFFQHVTKRHLVYFILVSLICGWIGVGIDQVLTDQSEGDTLGMLIWLVAPLLCAIILNSKSKDWFGFGHRLNLKNNGIWYLISILIFPVVMIFFVFIAMIFNAVEFGTLNSSIIPLMFAPMFFLFIKNIFEDFAWRGFLTAKLIKIKVNDFWIYIITGLVWALWHAAYYMVFLPEDIVGPSRLGVLGMSLIVIPIWGVMFTEIYRITGSVWPVVIMHMVEDAVPTLLIHEEHIITFKGALSLWLEPLQGIIPLAVYLIFGLWLRSQRIKLNKPESI